MQKIQFKLQDLHGGKGRVLDNIYFERLWRGIKRGKIYLNPPKGEIGLYRHIKDYILFYITERNHISIGHVTPNEKFYKKSKMHRNYILV